MKEDVVQETKVRLELFTGEIRVHRVPLFANLANIHRVLLVGGKAFVEVGLDAVIVENVFSKRVVQIVVSFDA